MTRYADRVAQETQSTGTGPVTLTAAIASYQVWATAFTDGPVYYGIVDEATGEWEIGIGTLQGGTQLTRDTILSSSFGGAAVSFGPGPKTVYCPEPAASRPNDMGEYN